MIGVIQDTFEHKLHHFIFSLVKLYVTIHICKAFILSVRGLNLINFFPLCYFYIIEYYRQIEHAEFRNNSFFSEFVHPHACLKMQYLTNVEDFFWIFIH